jgi:urease accessory protein
LRASQRIAHVAKIFFVLIMPTLYDHLVRAQAGTSYPKAQAVQLSYNERQRNRLAILLPDGQAAAIVLPRGQFMQPGDVLLASDDKALQIEAAVEPLMKVSSQTSLGLMRLIYHLANRHVRAMISADAVFIEPDPVLAQMIQVLGGQVQAVEAVFEPEAGAYAGGHHHHGEYDPADQAMGNIGEMLSIAAHQSRGNHADA